MAARCKRGRPAARFGKAHMPGMSRPLCECSKPEPLSLRRISTPEPRPGWDPVEPWRAPLRAGRGSGCVSACLLKQGPREGPPACRGAQGRLYSRTSASCHVIPCGPIFRPGRAGRRFRAGPRRPGAAPGRRARAGGCRPWCRRSPDAGRPGSTRSPAALDQKLHRYGDPRGGLGQRGRSAQAQHRGADPGVAGAPPGQASCGGAGTAGRLRERLSPQSLVSLA
jgi:hypothetical protein